MRPPLIIVCLLLSVVGAALSASLLRVHTAGSAGSLIAKVCGDQGGCDRVVTSRWAVLPPRSAERSDPVTPGVERDAIPVAALGLFYFSVLAVWFAAIGRPAGARRWLHLLVIGLCVLGCAASVWFIIVMGTKIKAWCPLCLATHAVNFVLLPAVVLARPRSGEVDAASRGEARPRDAASSSRGGHPGVHAAVLTVFLAAAVCWGEWGAYRAAGYRTEVEDASALLQRYAEDASGLELTYFKSEKQDINIREDDPILPASPGLRMTAVYFSQPACPHCALFERLLYEEVQPMFDGHLRVVYKHFPSEDPESLPFRASTALEAARLQEKFWEMHDALDERRKTLSTVDYGELAAELELDVEQFLADMGSAAVRKRIEEDIAEARRLDVHGTPGVFLNSRPLDRLMRGMPSFWKSRRDALRRLRDAQGQGW